MFIPAANENEIAGTPTSLSVNIPRHPDVSVVIACHTLRRWTWLVTAVASVRAQSPAEIVVVVDHNPQLHQRARRELTGVTVLANRFQPGASGSRNTGAFFAITPLVAFLDADAQARPDWLDRLVAPFADPSVVGTGGGILPSWERPPPRWFPDEFLWAVGGSYPGLPVRIAPVRSGWSANMAVRREVFRSIDGFRDGFGERGDRARPEDTDLCLRMGRGGGRWMYVPDALVDNLVPAERGTFGFFLRRCFHEGRGKIQMARLLDGRRSLSTEREYLRRTVPHTVLSGLSRSLRGGGTTPATRAGAVLAGVAAAAAGGAVETLAARRSGATEPQWVR